MADPHRAQDPERDLEQDVDQGQRDENVDEATGGRRAEGAEVPRRQEHPDRHDQGHRLGDLDGQQSAEDPPPPAGDALGHRQRMAHQGQWSPSDQQDGEGDSHHVGDQQCYQEDGEHAPHQDQEDAVVGGEGGEHELLQCLPRGVLVQPGAEHAAGQRVGELDRLGGQDERQRGGQEAQRDARSELPE
ncbi:hypothetical protein [Streptomyces sp. NPDC050704]|uniref:hypothetical protein n=1 Tax=Streptomyces sp. NPDC050704 TaxID=3157219 RepID=UPI00342DB250